MIDDLDIAFDDRHDKGRHRGRRAPGRYENTGKKKRKKKKKSRSGLALMLLLVMFAGLAGGLYYAYVKVTDYFTAPNYVTAAESAPVTVEIPQGALLADIAQILKDADVIASEQAFVDATNTNPDAVGIQPGVYQLRAHLSGDDAVLMLLDLGNRVVNGITIPEGLSTFKIYKLLAEKLDIPYEDFVAAAKDPEALGVPDWWFNRSDGKKVTKSVEGFLFPDTYEFHPGATAEDILKTMVGRFLTVTGDLNFADNVQANRGGISPYEALIVASLAQAEAGHKDDLGKVARVAYNRVFKPNGEVPCGCFEMDVTVNYWFEVQGKPIKSSADMTQSDLDNPKNPYNRKLKGFIPTPINNPGKEALVGAMDTPAGDWYFFVATDKEGHSAFASTHAEFCRDINDAIANGVLGQSSRC